MIEEFIRVLARIDALKQGRRWDDAVDTLDKEFRRLLGAPPHELARYTETELLALLSQGIPTQGVQDKALMLIALLNQAGEIAVAQGRSEEGTRYQVKALQMLLSILSRLEISECPAFVPRVQSLVDVLADAALPSETRAALMQHYERTGEYAKAEDLLHTLVEEHEGAPEILRFGLGFYQRLLRHSDTELARGNLPRSEVEEALAELERRLAVAAER